ncbi:uncharacterized protein BJ171DRAFT_511659 [Polychytrium aggregatum]|uniref:uncharacterized protein n=1 Tax=Polychytrium aggregatum TaxID=110093 RepID=UPI0022FDD04B|nr:uncharacterized protein BJ171DRAFT_511659 [Polychytrium aggregatum]KAI9203043.1 hypothetical protein BJ171DRAFT_511659 [Polychytrium aggregatum]
MPGCCVVVMLAVSLPFPGPDDIPKPGVVVGIGAGALVGMLPLIETSEPAASVAAAALLAFAIGFDGSELRAW